MENRIIELESRATFQEESLDALSQQLIQQQQEIDTLKREIEQLSQHLKAIQVTLLLDGDPVEPPPPHY